MHLQILHNYLDQSYDYYCHGLNELIISFTPIHLMLRTLVMSQIFIISCTPYYIAIHRDTNFRYIRLLNKFTLLSTPFSSTHM